MEVGWQINQRCLLDAWGEFVLTSVCAEKQKLYPK